MREKSEYEMKEIMKQTLFFELAQIPEDAELKSKYTLSEVFYKKMHRLMKKEERRARIVKYTKYIAAAASIIVLLFVLSHPTYVAQAKEQIIRWFETYTNIQFSEEAMMKTIPEYKLGYVPEGYALEREEYYDDAGIILYTNGEHQIDLFYGTSDASIDINNEQAEYYRLKGSDGETMEYFKSLNPKRKSTLTWLSNDGNVTFSLGGILDKEELIEIKNQIEEK